jgi:anti-sigma B factor antagonist
MVLTVVGELELTRAPSFGVDVSEVLREQPELVVIDLCHASFVDSAGLSVLLNARRRSVRLGIELRIACDVPTTLQTLAVTRLDRDLDVYPTLEAALAGGPPADHD